MSEIKAVTDLPTLNLSCLNDPSGRCVLIAESCVICRNREILEAHAAAYDEECEDFRLVMNFRKSERLAAARDAVLKLLPKQTALA